MTPSAELITKRAADLTQDEMSALRACSQVVYPPEVLAPLLAKNIEWAAAQWRVIAWDAGRVVAHVGIFTRQGTTNGTPVSIGGIGGVMTHPDERGKGLATRAIDRALQQLATERVDFALLVCKPELVPLYTKLGWTRYSGKLLVTQRGEPQEFTANLSMTHPIGRKAPTEGVIDLMGPPW